MCQCHTQIRKDTGGLQVFEMILLMAKSNLMQEISSSIYLYIFLDIIEIKKFGKSRKYLRISGIPLGRRGMIGPAGPAMRLGRTEGGPR